jgi:hypothetical protein
MRYIQARFANYHSDTPARYTDRYPSTHPVFQGTAKRATRTMSGFAKHTSMRKAIAQNQLKMQVQTQDFGIAVIRNVRVHQTQDTVMSKTRDFLVWFDEVWEGADKWRFDDNWKEFDDSWGQYTEHRLLLRVR